MGSLRYELTEAQWRLIELLLPRRIGTVGRPAENNRRFVNGVLWVIRSGMRWADLPERYGKYKSVHKRFVRWAEGGVGPSFRRSGSRPEEPVPDVGLDHRASTSAGGHGPQKGGEDKALGRSRGGLSTKIHLLANGLCEPVAFRLTAGQAAEYPEALPLLAGRQAEVVMADRGYDSNQIVDAIENLGDIAVIPSRTCRKQQRNHNRTLYKLHNRIERCFNQLKQFRRLATRYCKRRVCFQATIALACASLHLKQYVDTA